MKVLFTEHFRRKYKKLTRKIQSDFEKAYTQFAQDPFTPHLRAHKLKAFEGMWSFRISYSHRVLFRFLDKDAIELINIGDHQIYD